MFEKIEITKKDFLPLLQWCLIKYKLDPASRQGIGGREDKVGGFIDRFSNQCVNWIIFNHILSSEKISVDPDMFFYNAKSAKKCADIIGIKGENDKLVPLSYFVKDEWVHEDNAPFVEVKTVRKSQYCSGLGLPQYDDNHYYVYVESEFDELYLYNFFEKSSEENLEMSDRYIKDNSENIIKSPVLSLPNNIGTLRLLGIYKGHELKKHNLEYKQGQHPRYISSIESFNLEDIPENKKTCNTLINDKRFIYEPIDNDYKEFLPIYNDGASIELVHGEQKTMTYIYINVINKCFLNEYSLEKGYYKVSFKRFMRSSKETEIINHKSVYDSTNNKSNHFPIEVSDKLIQELGEFFNENQGNTIC